MKSISSVLGLVGLAACAPGDFQPNIIFWFPDETRAESLGGAYGHPLTKTPNYNRLAASGTAFTNCHVLHTQCAPSRHAMTTGRYLHTLGHRTQTHAVQDWEPNMFRYLKVRFRIVQGTPIFSYFTFFSLRKQGTISTGLEKTICCLRSFLILNLSQLLTACLITFD